MTINQLINELSDLGQEIGHNSEVKAWYLGDAGNLAPLQVLNVSGAEQGRNKDNGSRIAVVRIEP